MQKIGIITFHASHNCGSFLQSYALQKFLLKNHYESEIINFSNEGQQQFYKIVYKNNSIKNIIKNIILLPRRSILKETFNSYNDFINSKLILSKHEFHTQKELGSYNFSYDTYISGSDQIWNITIDDSDDSYFLNFVQNKKKIAYAPSFGAKRIKDYTDESKYEKYKQYLLNYDYISVREKNGQRWLQEMIQRKVPIVLDPTLLLDRNDYRKIEESYDSNISSPYIFYYSPSYDKNINILVKKIAKKYNLKVVAWNPKSYYVKLMNFNGFYLPKRQNPGVYLSLIKNASLIITTSFHGTIFSTIYNKKFWTIKNGGMYGNDDRVITLVEELKIQDRLIPMIFDENFNYMQDVDYIAYNHELQKLRKYSTQFLIEALKKNDET